MFSLRKSVSAAQERARVPAVAAALSIDGSVSVAGAAETPFRIASLTKSFTATALLEAGLLDEHARALLSHTAGYRPESAKPLPEPCAGLWSYSNAGYREAGARFDDYSASVRELVLAPLDLRSTGFETPPGAALGHQPDGVADPSYPLERRPGGGLWSTVGDLVTYGLAHCERWPELKQPVADALGASYGLGFWLRDGIVDHEGSVGGYQSLLLLVPAERLVLAVLTNSWRGTALIRHVVDDLGIVQSDCSNPVAAVDGRYALDTSEAVVAGERIREREVDPVTGGTVERHYRYLPGAPLMSLRSDFPRPGVARIGWTALPQVQP
ncbi:MAG: serine hydrolase domain-containing protein [Actinomycetota bacterium]